ncbi:MAG: Holliday junction resolvase RuvX, partial [Candidatus Sumerlaeaceae bacterium]|nr:Holliday junction resolvase RuvX [Candidatus Sumerlaeaceae bacterium]
QVRVGLAISDETQALARPLRILNRTTGRIIERIIETARAEGAVGIVVGMPLNMDGTTGPQARRYVRFADKLREAAPDLEIAHWDERLSSEEAREKLLQSGAGKKRRAQPIDDLAASIILQGFLDAQRAPQTP